METDKIILNRPNLSDMDSIISFFDDYEDSKYFRYDKFYTHMDKVLYLKKQFNEIDFFENYLWTITLKEENKIVGIISLRGIDKYENKAYLNYFLLKEFRKKGYMNEAIKLVISFSFEKLKLHKIKANVVENNIASRKTLEKLGFKLEGTLIDEVTLEKEYYNNCIYSLINPQK